MLRHIGVLICCLAVGCSAAEQTTGTNTNTPAAPKVRLAGLTIVETSHMWDDGSVGSLYVAGTTTTGTAATAELLGNLKFSVSPTTLATVANPGAVPQTRPLTAGTGTITAYDPTTGVSASVNVRVRDARGEIVVYTSNSAYLPLSLTVNGQSMGTLSGVDFFGGNCDLVTNGILLSHGTVPYQLSGSDLHSHHWTALLVPNAHSCTAEQLT